MGVAGFIKKALSVTLLLCIVLRPISAEAFSIIWISDTQLYSESYPESFFAISDWILSQMESKDIRFVFHTGDLVNASRSEKQWQNAQNAMSRLDGKVPYLTAAGNHDVGKKYNYNLYSSYIDSARKTQLPGGVYKEGRSRYALFSADGRDYVFISIGFEKKGPDKEETDWINGVLSYFNTRTAVLITHSYLHSNPSRLTSQGNVIFENIVKPNPNVWLILCGHCRKPASRTDRLDDDNDGKADRTVYTVLSNYQDAPRGGSAYVRILDFKKKYISFTTYSPVLDDYTYFDTPGMDKLYVLYPD